MTTRKHPEADKSAKRNKRLSLNKKTLKDLGALDKNPVAGRIRQPITISCPQP